MGGRAGPDSGPPPAPPAPSPAESTATRTGFGVQVAAVNSQAAADKLAGQLRTAGFASYVVREGALFRVRTGPYPDRATAATAAERIRKKLGHSPFVVKEP